MPHPATYPRRAAALPCLLLLVSGCARAEVTLVRAPGQAIQPQLAVGDDGTLHLVCFRGEARAGDLFYTRSTDGGASWARPLRVNSEPGAAIAAGNVRGAQLSLGRGGRPHIAWMGTKETRPLAPGDAMPMLYTRLNDDGTGFEPQRNLIQYAVGLDGGGTVAADRAGHVFVVWHGRGEVEGEEHRRVFLARSDDDGATFAREQPVNPIETGVCPCCQIRAFADAAGRVYINYRVAHDKVRRDTWLLVSSDGGATFSARKIDDWTAPACVMSTSTFTQTGDAVVMAWEGENQVRFGLVGADGSVANPITPPGEPRDRRRYPVAVRHPDGRTLLTWTAGMAWQRGGQVLWQVFDAEGRPTSDRGRADGVPAWSLIAAAVAGDGFLIVY